MCGIGDWITGVLKKDGAPVDSVVPKQGGIQWTESFSIGKGSQKQDIAKKFIQYMTSGPGQVRSAQMAAYPGMSPYKSGWTAINEANPEEAKRLLHRHRNFLGRRDRLGRPLPPASSNSTLATCVRVTTDRLRRASTSSGR